MNASKRYPRIMRNVRRVHLYLGLLLMPWLLLFGVTAFSFNHPHLLRSLKGQPLTADVVRTATGFEGWNANAVADSIVLGLKKQTGNRLELVDDSPRFSGWPIFASPAPGGKEVIILRLDQGGGVATLREDRQLDDPHPLGAETIDLPDYDLKTLAQQLTPLHGHLGIETNGPLRPHPKIQPEVRFRATDKDGKLWNLKYLLGTKKLEARPAAESSSIPIAELLESLHKQHHYPPSFGPTFLWAVFADLTALTLIFWAGSGLLMWWQMKKLRVAGLVFLFVAGVLALLVMGQTAGELTFGPEKPGRSM